MGHSNTKLFEHHWNKTQQSMQLSSKKLNSCLLNDSTISCIRNNGKNVSNSNSIDDNAVGINNDKKEYLQQKRLIDKQHNYRCYTSCPAIQLHNFNNDQLITGKDIQVSYEISIEYSYIVHILPIKIFPIF